MTDSGDEQVVDYEEEDTAFAMENGADSGEEGPAGGEAAGDEGMEDGEIIDKPQRRWRIPRITAATESGGDRHALALAAEVEYAEDDHRTRRRKMSDTEAMRLANTFSVSLDVIHAAHERRHDMTEVSLSWVALSLELDVNRGPKEPFSAWKERVAKTAHALGAAHPWDHLARFKSMPHDARWVRSCIICH